MTLFTQPIEACQGSAKSSHAIVKEDCVYELRTLELMCDSSPNDGAERSHCETLSEAPSGRRTVDRTIVFCKPHQLETNMKLVVQYWKDKNRQGPIKLIRLGLSTKRRMHMQESEEEILDWKRSSRELEICTQSIYSLISSYYEPRKWRSIGMILPP